MKEKINLSPFFSLLSLLGLFIFTSSLCAATYVSGRIATDTTWTKAGSPYIVTGELSIYGTTTTGVTLTIEPGVEVRFNSGPAGLSIGEGTNKGALIAIGTENAPIVFTSNAESPKRKDWSQIFFDNGTMDETTVMEHCVVKYAGWYSASAIYFNSASPTIRNCRIELNGCHGIRCVNSSPTIEHNTISNNSNWGIHCTDTNSSPTIVDNTISNNASYPLRIGANSVNKVNNNVYTNNSKQALEIIGERITKNMTYKNIGLPYIITGNVSVYGTASTGVTLTIEPGVEMRFNWNALSLSIGEGTNKGALIAIGTENAPIVFTSNAESPKRKDWSQIFFDNGTVDETTVMEYCIVKYAGWYSASAIYFNSASPTIRNCQIEQNGCHGIGCNNSSPAIEHNTISSNSNYGIHCTDTSSPTIVGNTISNNVSYPLRIGANSVNKVNNNVYKNNGKQALEILGERITKNMTYKNIGLPYIFTGNVSVYGTATTGATLTIEPGVEMRFNYNPLYLSIGDGTNKGALIAIGTENAPIIFTSNAESPNRGDWRQIFFDNGTMDETTVMEHCVVKYAGWYGVPAIVLHSASPTIRNCTITLNEANGIFCDNSLSIIEQNIISYNNQYGVRCGGAASPEIVNNAIHHNPQGGIYYSCSTPIAVMYNNIYSNNRGIYANGSGSMQIIRNNLYDNSGHYIYNNTNLTINARKNWWGDGVTSEIKTGGNPKNISKIYDKYDNSAKGEVYYGEWIYEPIDPSFSLIPGLRVVNHWPNGYQTGAVNNIQFTFDQPIHTNTFTWKDISIINPTGEFIPITNGPTHVGGTTYQITFSPQSHVGAYHAFIGPLIANMEGILMDQDGDGAFGERPDDQYDAQFTIVQTSGPFVSFHTPSQTIKPPVSYIELHFHQPIDPASFDIDDVTITGPSGTILPQLITPLPDTDSKSFVIEFPEQAIAGTYQTIIGPDITNFDGDPMDQDKDQVNNEYPDDQYLAEFTIDDRGPKIIAHSIFDIQNVPVKSIDLTFNETINPNTFPEEAVTITGPAGDVTVLRVTRTSAEVFTLHLASFQINSDGIYTGMVAPLMTDSAGNALDQDEDGLNGEEDDDRYTFEFIQELPDLEVSQITHPLEIRSNESMEITWTVTNVGLGQTTGPWTDTVYLSTDETIGSDITIGQSQYTAPLDPAQSYNRAITATIPEATDGQRWIIVKANSQNTLCEHGDDTNNILAATPPMWVTRRDAPDLQVTSVTPPDSLPVGEQATIFWTVQNFGPASTSATYWHDKIYLSLNTALDKDDIEVTSFRNPDLLLAGDSYTQTKDISIPLSLSSNSYYILVKTDADDREEEFDLENNNLGGSQTTAGVIIPPPAFLSVASVEVLPPQANPGDPVTVTWTVQNTGGSTANVEKIDHIIILSKDDVFVWGQDRILCAHIAAWSGEYPPGGEYTVSHEIVMPENIVGNYYLIPWPDPPQWTGLDKNLAAGPITIVIPDPPDLHITSINAPSACISGQKMSLNWIIENQGNGKTRTSPWDDVVFLSDDQVLDAVDQELCRIPHYGVVDAYQTYEGVSSSVAIPPGIAGTYYLLVSTDHTDSVHEAVETNNVKAHDTPITISLIESDLKIQTASTSGNNMAGQTITVQWEVINAGASATAIDTWKEKIYLSQDTVLSPQNDSLLGTVTHTGALSPTAHYSQSQAIKLPQRIEGAYYLILMTDAENILYEHNQEENNTYTISITITDPAADLVVESFTAPSSGIAEKTIQVNWLVQNTGSASVSTNWKDSIYFSRDTAFDPAVDSVLSTFSHTEPLPAGSEYGPDTTHYELLLPPLPDHQEGDYYLFYFADKDGQVYEKDRKENNISPPYPITLSECAPDLQVQSAVIPAEGIAGEVIAVDWTIMNNGNAEAVRWKDALYLSKDTIFNVKEDLLWAKVEQIQSLEPGHTTGPPSEPFQIKLPDRIFGDYYLFIVTDSEHTVYEKTLEDNNLYGLQDPIAITIMSADLQITRINVPHTAKAGSAITIGWTVENVGSRTTEESLWKDGVYLSEDTVFDPSSDLQLGLIQHKGGLSLHETYTVAKEFLLPQDSMGLYYVYAVTDKTDQVYEHQGENNNTAASPGTMEVIPLLTDLKIQEFSVPANCYPGDTIQVSWTVTNQGADTTGVSSWEDTVYFSPHHELDYQAKTLLTIRSQGNLASGASYTQLKTVTMPKSYVGDFYLLVKTDAHISNHVFEYGKENNNTAFAPITVSYVPTPDLRVTGINIPATAWSGQKCAIEWQVTNDSDAPTTAASGSWSDSVYLSRDPYFDKSNDIALGNIQHKGDLVGGGAYVSTIAAKLPEGISGPYYAIVITDSSTPDRVFERDLENNNSTASSTTLMVTITPPADLVITSITPPANGIYGEEAEFRYEVINIGDLEAQGAWYDMLYLSKDQMWDLADHPIEIIYHQGNVAKDQTYSETITARLPAVLPGDYYVLAHTDILDDVRETDNTNNTTASAVQIRVEGRELPLDFIDSNTIARDQSIYYQITMEEDKDLIISLSSAAKDKVELFVACGRIPTRSDFDVKGQKGLLGDLHARILRTRSATYYILVYGYDCPVPAPSYIIEAHLPDHSIEDLSLSEGGNTGPVTVAISGYNYTPKTKAYLKDPNGNIIATGEVNFQDTGSLSATFDLTGATAGNYHIELENPDGSLCSENFDVVEGKGGEVYANLLMPNLVRPGRPYQLTLEYGNIGDADVYAPLLTVNAGEGVLLRLNSSEEFSGEPIIILGIGDINPVTILPPGSIYTIEMEFILASDDITVPIYLGNFRDFDDSISWDKLDFRPQGADPAVWDGLWARFQAQIGTTWGDYARMLRDNARHLGTLGDRVYDIRDLLAFEALQAAGFGAPKTLIEKEDAYCPAPGLSLSFHRRFCTGIKYRNRKGPFGFSWTHNYQKTLTQNGDGKIVISGSGGLDRTFIDYGGWYEAPLGDFATLVNQNGIFILTEKEGTVYSFQGDGKLSTIEDKNNNKISLSYDAAGLLNEIKHSNGYSFFLHYNADGYIQSLVDHTGRVTEYFYKGDHLIKVVAPGYYVTTYTYNTSDTILLNNTLSTVTYPDGTADEFTYDALGRLKERQSCCSEKIEYSYGPSGIVQIYDDLGLLSTTSYDRNGNPAIRENAQGTITRQFYDPQYGIVKRIDPLGAVTTFKYDRRGNMTKINDPAGYTTQMTYTMDDLIQTETNSYGATITYDYDQAGNCIQEIDPLGNITTYTYDEQGNRASITDPLGNTSTYEFNAMGRVTRIVDPQGNETTYTYDALGKKISMTDAYMKTTHYEYDNLGRLTKITDPSHNTIIYTHDYQGNITSRKGLNGKTRYYEYDSRGNLLKEIDPLGNEMHHTYDIRGKRTSVTDAAGNITRFEYDAAGRLSAMIDPNNNRITNTYDLGGNLLSQEDAQGAVTRYEYDLRGNRIKSTDQCGHEITYSYDAENKLISVTNAKNNTASYEYDLKGRVTRVVDPKNEVTTFTYDANDNLVSVTDAKGQKTFFAYDGLNRKIAMTNALGEQKTYAYDKEGRVKAKVLFSGDSITYEYDELGRLTAMNLPDGKSTTYTYDAADNITAINNPYASLSFIYDENNQIVSVQTEATPYQPESTITYTYDENGNINSMTDSLGGQIHYAYGKTNNLAALTCNDGTTITYAYDENDRLIAKSFPNNLVSSYNYYPDGNLKSIRHQLADNDITHYTYEYDSVGNRTKMATPAGEHTYLYDALDQLLQADHPQMTQEVYTYDTAGNRTSSSDSSSWLYDKQNKLLDDDTFTYQYKNGCLIQKTNASSGQITTYTYNAHNQLTGITTPTSTISYYYDGLGRRICKEINGVKTYYLYDREDILYTLDSGQAIISRYTHGPWTDDPLKVDQVGTTYYYFADGLNSITHMMDASGNVVQQYDYDSFGNIINQTGSMDNPYTYTGREYDPESGLYYYRARYYDPKIGRFLSSDPIGFGSGDLNLYRYVGNNPMNWVDPWGLEEANATKCADNATAKVNAEKESEDKDPCELEDKEEEKKKQEEFKKIKEWYENLVKERRKEGWTYGVGGNEIYNNKSRLYSRGKIDKPKLGSRGRVGGVCTDWQELISGSPIYDAKGGESIVQKYETQWENLDIEHENWVRDQTDRQFIDSHFAAVFYPAGLDKEECGKVLDPWYTGEAKIYDIKEWKEGNTGDELNAVNPIPPLIRSLRKNISD